MCIPARDRCELQHRRIRLPACKTARPTRNGGIFPEPTSVVAPSREHAEGSVRDGSQDPGRPVGRRPAADRSVRVQTAAVLGTGDEIPIDPGRRICPRESPARGIPVMVDRALLGARRGHDPVVGGQIRAGSWRIFEIESIPRPPASELAVAQYPAASRVAHRHRLPGHGRSLREQHTLRGFGKHELRSRTAHEALRRPLVEPQFTQQAAHRHGGDPRGPHAGGATRLAVGLDARERLGDDRDGLLPVDGVDHQVAGGHEQNVPIADLARAESRALLAG